MRSERRSRFAGNVVRAAPERSDNVKIAGRSSRAMGRTKNIRRRKSKLSERARERRFESRQALENFVERDHERRCEPDDVRSGDEDDQSRVSRRFQYVHRAAAPA